MIATLIHLLVIIGFGHVEFVEIWTRELKSAADGIKGSCTEIVVQGTDVQRIWKLSECIGVWSKMGRNASEQEGYTHKTANESGRYRIYTEYAVTRWPTIFTVHAITGYLWKQEDSLV